MQRHGSQDRSADIFGDELAESAEREVRAWRSRWLSKDPDGDQVSQTIFHLLEELEQSHQRVLAEPLAESASAFLAEPDVEEPSESPGALCMDSNSVLQQVRSWRRSWLTLDLQGDDISRSLKGLEDSHCQALAAPMVLKDPELQAMSNELAGQLISLQQQVDAEQSEDPGQTDMPRTMDCLMVVLREISKAFVLFAQRLGMDSPRPMGSACVEFREITERLSQHDAKLSLLQSEYSSAVDPESLVELEQRLRDEISEQLPKSGEPVKAEAFSEIVSDDVRELEGRVLELLTTRSEEHAVELRSTSATHSARLDALEEHFRNTEEQIRKEKLDKQRGSEERAENLQTPAVELTQRLGALEHRIEEQRLRSDEHSVQLRSNSTKVSELAAETSALADLVSSRLADVLASTKDQNSQFKKSVAEPQSPTARTPGQQAVLESQLRSDMAEQRGYFDQQCAGLQSTSVALAERVVAFESEIRQDFAEQRSKCDKQQEGSQSFAKGIRAELASISAGLSEQCKTLHGQLHGELVTLRQRSDLLEKELRSTSNKFSERFASMLLELAELAERKQSAPTSTEATGADGATKAGSFKGIEQQPKDVGTLPVLEVATNASDPPVGKHQPSCECLAALEASLRAETMEQRRLLDDVFSQHRGLEARLANRFIELGDRLDAMLPEAEIRMVIATYVNEACAERVPQAEERLVQCLGEVHNLRKEGTLHREAVERALKNEKVARQHLSAKLSDLAAKLGDKEYEPPFESESPLVLQPGSSPRPDSQSGSRPLVLPHPTRSARSGQQAQRGPQALGVTSLASTPRASTGMAWDNGRHSLILGGQRK